MNQEQQIILLNSSVKCNIGPSPIHGLGVFALTDIQKGQKCYCKPPFLDTGVAEWFHVPYGSFKKLFPEVRELILNRFPAVINGSRFLSPNDMIWLLTYINHSDNPNYDVDTDTATRLIKAGEEIVQDYRRMDNYEKLYPFLK